MLVGVWERCDVRKERWKTLSHERQSPILIAYFLVLLKRVLDFLLLADNEYEMVLEQGNNLLNFPLRNQVSACNPCSAYACGRGIC